MTRFTLAALLLVLLRCVTLSAAEPVASDAVVTIDHSELAGMSMFRAHWDTPLVLKPDAPQRIVDTKVTDRGGVADWKEGSGPAAFDALNRALLLRFPGAAETIAAELAKGKTIVSAHVLLPYRDEELWPVGLGDFVSPSACDWRRTVAISRRR